MFWFNGLSGTMDARENEVVLTNALVYIWKRIRDDRSVPMSNELVLSAESVTNNYQQFTILINIKISSMSLQRTCNSLQRMSQSLQ